MTSLNNQEVSIEEMDLLNIQCASVKGKLNKANYTITMYKKKFIDGINCILATKNEKIIIDYLISIQSDFCYYYYPEVGDYTNKAGKTHKAYICEYGYYRGKYVEGKTPPIVGYYESFEEFGEILDYNSETGRFELNKPIETDTGKFLNIANNRVDISP